MANMYLFLDNRRPDKDGRSRLKVALFHKGKAAYYSLDIHLADDEWDSARLQVTGRPDKKFLNVEIRKTFAEMSAALLRIERREDFETLTAKEIIDMASRGASTVDEPADLDYVVPVYNEYITLCRKASTTQVYKSSLRNLMEYCDDIDSLRFKDITGAWLRRYQNWLLEPKNEKHPELGGKGMEVNGANVYLRNLRTIFNYALNNQFTKAAYPFKQIDMSTTDPDKRMVAYDKFLDWATIPMPDYRDFYRDLFMLSFYLCGIRPVDLLYLKKSNVEDGRIVYKPQKLNGKTTLSIKIEPEAMEIIKKYEGKGEYLLSIMDTRSDYKEFCKHWNTAVRAIGEDVITQKVGRNGKKYSTVKHIGIVPYITIYYARTLWATYQYNIMDVPMDTISQGLGHKSGLRVTNFYVKRDYARVDKANREFIDRVKKDMDEYRKKRASAS